ncbi:myosin-10-like [Macrobrachium nipponense]|uniref:myosin-10-like n=1 Tax=Macrobrachium nipponense TaxID=159736 RepID=UPI0030C7DF91
MFTLMNLNVTLGRAFARTYQFIFGSGCRIATPFNIVMGALAAANVFSVGYHLTKLDVKDALDRTVKDLNALRKDHEEEKVHGKKISDLLEQLMKKLMRNSKLELEDICLETERDQRRLVPGSSWNSVVCDLQEKEKLNNSCGVRGKHKQAGSRMRLDVDAPLVNIQITTTRKVELTRRHRRCADFSLDPALATASLDRSQPRVICETSSEEVEGAESDDISGRLESELNCEDILTNIERSEYDAGKTHNFPRGRETFRDTDPRCLDYNQENIRKGDTTNRQFRRWRTPRQRMDRPSRGMRDHWGGRNTTRRKNIKEKTHHLPNIPLQVNQDRFAKDNLLGQVNLQEAQAELHRKKQEKLEASNRRLLEHIRELKQEKRQMLHRENELKNENQKLRDNVKILKEHLIAVECKNEKKVSAARKHAEKMNEAEAKIQKLARQLDVKEREAKQCQDEAKELRHKICEMDDQLTEIRDENERMRCDLQGKEELLQCRDAEKQKCEACLQELQQEGANKVRLISQLQGEIGRLKCDRQDEHKHVEHLEGLHRNLQEENDKLRQLLRRCLQDRRDLEAELLETDIQLASFFAFCKEHHGNSRASPLRRTDLDQSMESGHRRKSEEEFNSLNKAVLQMIKLMTGRAYDDHKDRAKARAMINELKRQKRNLGHNWADLALKTHLDIHVHLLDKTRGRRIKMEMEKIQNCACQNKNVLPTGLPDKTTVIPQIKQEEKESTPTLEDEKTSIAPPFRPEEKEVIPTLEDEKTSIFPRLRSEEKESIPQTVPGIIPTMEDCIPTTQSVALKEELIPTSRDTAAPDDVPEYCNATTQASAAVPEQFSSARAAFSMEKRKFQEEKEAFIKERQDFWKEEEQRQRLYKKMEKIASDLDRKKEKLLLDQEQYERDAEELAERKKTFDEEEKGLSRFREINEEMKETLMKLEANITIQRTTQKRKREELQQWEETLIMREKILDEKEFSSARAAFSMEVRSFKKREQPSSRRGKTSVRRKSKERVFTRGWKNLLVTSTEKQKSYC